MIGVPRKPMGRQTPLTDEQLLDSSRNVRLSWDERIRRDKLRALRKLVRCSNCGRFHKIEPA